MKNDEEDYITYSYRWLMLLLYCLLEMTNCMMWVTFVSISNISRSYFGNSNYNTTTGINMLANVFMILYLPGTIFGVVLMKSYNMRVTLLICGSITTFGSLVRYIAALSKNNIDDNALYWLMFLGQCIVATSQPTLVNFPSLLSSAWFPVKERDISTSIGAMAGAVGNGIGQLIPALIVSQYENDDDDNYTVTGMADLMLVEFILCAVPLTVSFVYLKDKPPTAPSQSTKLKLDNVVGNPILRSYERDFFDTSGYKNSDNNDNDGAASNNDTKSPTTETTNDLIHTTTSSSNDNATVNNNSVLSDQGSELRAIIKEENRRLSISAGITSTLGYEALGSFWHDFKQLLCNGDYMILLLCFSISIGLFSAILTMLNQMVLPFGYSNTDTGTFATVVTVVGFFGTALFGVIMKRTKALRSLLKICFLLTAIATTLFLSMLFSDNFWALLISMALYGFFLIPEVPLMMENAAESTYPISEDLSTGLLFVGCNIVGFIFVFIIQILLEEPSFGPPPFLPSNLFIFIVTVSIFILILFYNGKYRRLERETLIDRIVPDFSLFRRPSTMI